MKTCFTTVIYKQAQPYIQDLLVSLEKQTDRDFDILIFNDNFSKEELAALNIKGDRIHLIDLNGRGLSIPGTRVAMLKESKAMGYELAVFGDADDMLSENRIASYKQAAELDKDCAFFYNVFVTEKGEKVFKTLPDRVENIQAITQYNYLGLSNTGARLDKLSEEFIESLYEGECMVFDWYIFSRIILDVGNGCHVKDAATIYRIYEDNLAGVNRDIEKEYNVKMIHYTNLAKRYDLFVDMLEKLKKVDVASLHHAKDHQGYWWSDIKL